LITRQAEELVKSTPRFTVVY